MTEREKFDVVLLSGGGIKGIGELGALHYHYENGPLDLEHVEEYVGTSIGSLINLLMVCGYTPMEIFTKVYTTNEFFKLPELGSPLDIFSNYGIASIHSLFRIVEELVISKIKKIPTLLELKNITGKLLTITVVNVSKKRVEYINYETHPSLNAIDAIKMSCNLPFIFHKIKYNGDYWVDGGLADSFPYGGVKNKTGNILGVIVSGIDISTGTSEDTFINYIYNLIVIPMNPIVQLRTKNIGKNVKLVIVNFDNISILNFSIENDKKMEMFMKGYQVAKREDEKEILYIKDWKFDIENEDEPQDVIADLPILEHSADGWETWEGVFDD